MLWYFRHFVNLVLQCLTCLSENWEGCTEQKKSIKQNCTDYGQGIMKNCLEEIGNNNNNNNNNNNAIYMMVISQLLLRNK